MTAPRVEVDLAKVTHNAATLVGLLAPLGIAVAGVTKATLGNPAVAEAMQRGGVRRLGDARVENVERLRAGGVDLPVTMVRSPMLSQVARVVAVADASLTSEAAVIAALSAAATAADRPHGVVLMVELGDLREGAMAADIVDLARLVHTLPALSLRGLGTNLACQSGVAPDAVNMAELSRLVEVVESAGGERLAVVSGGNSANLDWALGGGDVGRVDELRLGEAILLGREPLRRHVLPGLHTDAFTLVAEVIEAKLKPSRSWGTVTRSAFGAPPPRVDLGPRHQVILALGRQDVDPDGLVAPPGMLVLGASSDHLVLDADDGDLRVGDEVRFELDYSALVRALTSPFVATKVLPAA